MNKRTHTKKSKDFVRCQVNQGSQSLQEDQDIEAVLSSTQVQAGLEGEEGRCLADLTEESSVKDDPRRRPGAHAIRGINASPSFPSSEHSSQEETENVAAQPGVLFIAQSAQLVDEAAEEQRHQEYERERQRNRELENRIQQIESDAVVAIPVNVEEDADRPKPSTRSQDRARTDCFWSRKFRKCFAGGLLVLVVAAVVGSVLGVVLGNGRGDTQANVPIDQPTSTPKVPATSSPTASPTSDVSTWNQVGQSLEGEAAGDWFGFSVALSANGTVVAGGAIRNNFNGWYDGHVRVFSYDSGFKRWNQLGQDLNGKEPRDEFGHSVGLSNDGNIVAAGALTYPDGNGYVQVHAFNSATNQWSQIGQVLEGRAPRDWFGFSVALSADGATLAAGGPGRLDTEDEYSGNKTGYVRVLALDNTTSLWTPKGQDLNGTGIGDAFGRSVALSANGIILAVGAYRNDANGQDAGRVQVFAYDSGIDRWEQIGQEFVGEGARDVLGFAVALSEDGTIVAVGAPWNFGTNGRGSGHVRVFSYDLVNSRWNQMGQDIDGESEDNNFGVSVALSADGMIVVAGSNRNDGKGGEFSGHVRVFSYNSTAMHWSQVGRDLDGEGENDAFGISVALSSDGTIVAAGAYQNDGNGPDSGHIRVYETMKISD